MYKGELADLRSEVERLTLQLKRWQDVAWIDGADVTARARREGVDVENNLQYTAWLQEFYRKVK